MKKIYKKNTKWHVSAENMANKKKAAHVPSFDVRDLACLLNNQTIEHHYY